MLIDKQKETAPVMRWRVAAFSSLRINRQAVNDALDQGWEPFGIEDGYIWLRKMCDVRE